MSTLIKAVSFAREPYRYGAMRQRFERIARKYGIPVSRFWFTAESDELIAARMFASVARNGGE